MADTIESAGVVVQANEMVPMRDGVRLSTVIYRPDDAQRHPVLLMRWPYHPGLQPIENPYSGLASLGYAVVVQHSRGRYESEGDFNALHVEVDDGYDAVEWAAAQEWSDGRVAMFGASYGGMTQWAAALAHPPHLVALAPATCPFTYRQSFPFRSPGVLPIDILIGWTGFMARHCAERRNIADPVLEQMVLAEEMGAAIRPGAGSAEIRVIAERMRAHLLPLLEQRPITDIELFEDVAPWWRDWLTRPDPQDPYWMRLSPALHPEDITVPTLTTTGWYDMFLTEGLTAFTSLRERGGGDDAVRRSHKLVIGFWGHGTPSETVQGHLEGVDVGAGEAEAGAVMVTYFSRLLLGAPTPGPTDDAPIRLFVMGDNAWRDEWEWPLARTVWTDLYLHSGGHANTRHGDGTLSPEIPARPEPADEYEYDPTNPVPQHGGQVCTMLSMPGPGPFDQGAIEDRGDVLVYTTQPFTSEMEITGPVSAHLWASSSAVSTDFTVKLIDVFPDGRPINLCQGIVRTAFAGPEPRPSRPGEIRQFEINLMATSTVIQPGHRVRLEISSSCYPTYDLNPNTGRHLPDDTTTETIVAYQRIYHDADRPSLLRLPVIPR